MANDFSMSFEICQIDVGYFLSGGIFCNNVVLPSGNLT